MNVGRHHAGGSELINFLSTMTNGQPKLISTKTAFLSFRPAAGSLSQAKNTLPAAGKITIRHHAIRRPTQQFSPSFDKNPGVDAPPKSSIEDRGTFYKPKSGPD